MELVLGKSTLAENIKKEFENNITMISHDYYYKAHPELPFEERTKLNYDHPDSIETSLLIEHLKEVPLYLEAHKTNIKNFNYSKVHNKIYHCNHLKNFY